MVASTPGRIGNAAAGRVDHHNGASRRGVEAAVEGIILVEDGAAAEPRRVHREEAGVRGLDGNGDGVGKHALIFHLHLGCGLPARPYGATALTWTAEA